MVISSLNKKLFRDLNFIKAQIFTIAIVVAIGIGNLIGFLSTFSSLQEAQLTFYTWGQFSNVFATLKRAPLSVITELERIPGVLRSESRLTYDALMYLENLVEPITIRFISIPDGSQPVQNKIFLREGRLPFYDQSDEIVLNEGIALAHHLQLGDTINTLVNGRDRHLKIVGIGVSPECIFAVSGNGMPDDRHFGFAWINRSSIEKNLDLAGAFNSLTFHLSSTASAEKVISMIDNKLKIYGGIGSYTRKDQGSHYFLQEEFKQLKVQATIMPIVFLIVAIYLLHVILNRIIYIQRSEIATLRALGYTKIKISNHYLKMALLIALLGALFGVLLGTWVGHGMTNMYTKFYHFPILKYHLSFYSVTVGILASIITALFGVYFSIREIFLLTPAESMLPPSPPNFSQSILEKIKFFNQLPITTKMVFRGISVHRIRTILTIFGMSFTLMLAISGLFWMDSLKELLTVQFSVVQKETARVQLTTLKNYGTVEEFKNIPNVLLVEGYRTIPIKIKINSKNKNSAIIGFPSKNKLWDLINQKLIDIPIPERGALISRALAKQFNINDNQDIVIEILEGKRETKNLHIAKVIDDYLGANIYMSLNAANDLMQEGTLINTINIRARSMLDSDLYRAIRKIPSVASVSFKDNALKTFNETSGTTMLVISSILMIFAAAITIGIVYNSARVSLAERDWELATLRILGFRKTEVFIILISEIIFLLLICIPVGWILGYGMSWIFMKLMTPESMQFPFVVYPKTFAISTLVLISAAAFTFIFIGNRVNKLDLIATLKSRG